ACALASFRPEPFGTSIQGEAPMFREYLQRGYQTLIQGGRQPRLRSGSRPSRPAAARLAVEGLEDRALPSTLPPTVFAVGADVGGGPEVKVYDAVTNQLRSDFYAYDPSFSGGVRVAVGDVTGDGTPDIITAPGPSGGPNVKVFDGKTGALLQSFYAY